MKRPCVVVFVCLALVLVGCDRSEEAPETRAVDICGQTVELAAESYAGAFSVDCSFMSATGPGLRATSLLRVVGDAAGDVQAPRCALILEGPVPDGASVTMPYSATKGSASVTLLYQGTQWRPRLGCIALTDYTGQDQPEGLLGVGTYSGVFDEFDAQNRPTGRFATGSGAIDWCEYGKRSDCPVQFDSGLNKRVEVSASAWNLVTGAPMDTLTGSGQANACRVLIERDTGKARVDLQLGFWDGVPITQYGQYCLFTDQVLPARNNHFLVEASGITGPGTYTLGPFCNRDPARAGASKSWTPMVRWEVPSTWVVRDSDLCFTNGIITSSVEIIPTPFATCALTIEDAPGRVAVVCEGMRWMSLLSNNFVREDALLALEADCDVRYR